VATPAFAQSGVAVYGIVDLDGEYLFGHAKDIRVTSGGLSSLSVMTSEFSAFSNNPVGPTTGQTSRTRLADGSLCFTQGPLDPMVSRVDDRSSGASAATSTHVAATTVAANVGGGACHIEAATWT